VKEDLYFGVCWLKATKWASPHVTGEVSMVAKISNSRARHSGLETWSAYFLLCGLVQVTYSHSKPPFSHSFFLVVLEFELRASCLVYRFSYRLSHSASLILPILKEDGPRCQ
jgi:hypothetical protein